MPLACGPAQNRVGDSRSPRTETRELASVGAALPDRRGNILTVSPATHWNKLSRNVRHSHLGGALGRMNCFQVYCQCLVFSCLVTVVPKGHL